MSSAGAQTEGHKLSFIPAQDDSSPLTCSNVGHGSTAGGFGRIYCACASADGTYTRKEFGRSAVDPVARQYSVHVGVGA